MTHDPAEPPGPAGVPFAPAPSSVTPEHAKPRPARSLLWAVGGVVTAVAVWFCGTAFMVELL
jgi:hypothetical protein